MKRSEAPTPPAHAEPGRRSLDAATGWPAQSPTRTGSGCSAVETATADERGSQARECADQRSAAQQSL
eukprot:3831096-Pyramimonas_sp.AAC.1